MIRTHLFPELIVFKQVIKVSSIDVGNDILSSLINPVLPSQSPFMFMKQCHSERE